MITNFIVGLHIASRNHTYGSDRWEYSARFYYCYDIFGRLVTPIPNNQYWLFSIGDTKHGDDFQRLNFNKIAFTILK